jgi:hypothetical protein
LQNKIYGFKIKGTLLRKGFSGGKNERGQISWEDLSLIGKLKHFSYVLLRSS